MFSSMTGAVTGLHQGMIILNVNGVGFQLFVPLSDIFQANQQVSLSVYMHWNAENGPSLFGFSSELEKETFLLIISCSGIGPKMALALLNQLSPSLFIKAIQEGDQKALSSVSGIGPKKAEQIIVQLRHKVEKLLDKGMVFEDGADNLRLEEWKNVTQVLQSLNYSKTEIETALAYVRKENQANGNFDFLIRQALSFLSKRV